MTDARSRAVRRHIETSAIVWSAQHTLETSRMRQCMTSWTRCLLPWSSNSLFAPALTARTSRLDQLAIHYKLAVEAAVRIKDAQASARSAEATLARQFSGAPSMVHNRSMSTLHTCAASAHGRVAIMEQAFEVSLRRLCTALFSQSDGCLQDIHNLTCAWNRIRGEPSTTCLTPKFRAQAAAPTPAPAPKPAPAPATDPRPRCNLQRLSISTADAASAVATCTDDPEIVAKAVATARLYERVGAFARWPPSEERIVVPAATSPATALVDTTFVGAEKLV